MKNMFQRISIFIVAVFLVSLIPNGIFVKGITVDIGTNLGFEDGLTGWTYSADATSSNQKEIVTGIGSITWTVNAYGNSMAVLSPPLGINPEQLSGINQMNDTMGFSNDSKDYLEEIFGQNQIKSYSFIYQDVEMEAGDKLSFSWNYVSTDHDFYNDGSIAVMVNTTNNQFYPKINDVFSQVAILGTTASATGNYTTGSYGSTGWQSVNFESVVSGTYRVGFVTFNLKDFALSPYLMIDNGAGTTFTGGTPFGPIPPDDNPPPTFKVSTLFYSSKNFHEAPLDDGSIETKITVSIDNDTFTGEIGETFNAVAFSNVPAGLVAKAVKTGDKTIEISFEGTALQHAVSDTVSNVTMAFSDDAFTIYGVNETNNTVTSDLNIQFKSFGSVQFATDGGSTINPLKVEKGTQVTKPTDPTKAGYTFEGWYTEAALENKWDFEKDTIPAEHITLHAKWSANTNTKYVVNHYKEKLDGTYELEDQEEFTGITDTEITAPVKIYIGFSVDRTHEDEFATGIIDGSGTLELSLYYQRDSFEVVFKDWDGTVLKEVTLKYESGAKAPTGMTREGYTFTHWDEDFTKITEDLEVKAIYTINQYDVSFEENGGSEVLNLRQDFNTLIESNTATSRIGYTFEGWFTDAALETEWDFAVDKVPAQNITLYAKWSAKTDTVYKVKHYREALDGTYVEFEKEIKIGTTDTTGTAAANTYEGFTYLKDHEDEISSGNIRGDGSLVLELYYDRNEYRIIFRGFDGVVLVDDMMKYGESIELPEDPEKAGYIFKGWMKEVPETVPAKDESFESLWEITAAEEVRQKIEALPSLDEVGKEDGALLMEIKKLMDQLTEEELKYLKPEDIEKFQKSSTVYVEMSFTDEKTKVRVNAAENTYFDPNLKLVVEEVKLGALKDTADKNLLTIRKNKEILQVFDISLLLNNVEVQPDGIIRIYLPLSKELKNSYKDLEVIYVAEDGKITVMPSKVEGDYLVFETDHLSYYSIIGTKINALPSLGEETSSAALGFLLLAVGLCLYVPWRKRKTA